MKDDGEKQQNVAQECRRPTLGEKFEDVRNLVLKAEQDLASARERMLAAKKDHAFCEVIYFGRTEQLRNLLRESGV